MKREFAPQPFVPRRFLTNAHVQTVLGNFLPRQDCLPEPVDELVEVSPASDGQIATQVLCRCHWQPAAVRAEQPAVIVVHGLEGSANSQYVVGNANKLWREGTSVIRMNMRNCGGRNYEMAQRSPTLYHSGLSGDVGAVMQHFLSRESLQSIALVGYSMGGNLVLKLAGELGQRAPRELHAVVGVSPAIDLGPSATALHRVENRIYEWRFLRALLKRYRHKVQSFPQAYAAERADGVRSLREFDDRVTALYSGFNSAEDYYYRASAARVIERISVPTLILHSKDDPFVSITTETLAKLEANQHITLIQPEHGGHCAFLARRDSSNMGDGYWAETTLPDFILANA